MIGGILDILLPQLCIPTVVRTPTLNLTNRRSTMRNDGVIGTIGQQEWLKPVEEGLQKLLHKTSQYKGGASEELSSRNLGWTSAARDPH